MDRGLWLGRFVDPNAIRRQAGLHLYSCREAEGGARRVVLLGAPGTETTSAAGVLDALARGHGLVEHPLVPRVAARGRAGEIEFLALACDGIVDFEQFQGEVARKPGKPFQYAKGVAVYRALLGALEAIHAAHDAVHEGPLGLGRWSWANVLLSEDARLWLIGPGRPRRPGSPWLVPEATEFAAPEVKLGTRVGPSADLSALFMLMMSTMSMVALPPAMERVLAGAGGPGDAEVERQFNAYQQAAMAMSPRERHQSAGEAREKLDALMSALDVAADFSVFQTASRELVQRLQTGQQVTSAGKTGRLERLDVPSCVAGRYRVDRLLGEGGMGRVFLAWDRQLGQRVALKLSTTSGDAEQEHRFLREVRIARQVRHAHLVHGYDLVRQDGQAFAVMEYIEGERLDACFARQPDAAAARARLGEVADALASLHRMGVVHRDVKPSNILVSAERGAVLLDYGVASEPDSELTHTGAALGTPQFMAPEQAGGAPAGPACDVYALAVVARGLPADAALAELWTRCTARAPEARPSMDEVARALQQ